MAVLSSGSEECIDRLKPCIPLGNPDNMSCAGDNFSRFEYLQLTEVMSYHADFLRPVYPLETEQGLR